jgi:hypothetical protein
MESFTDGRCVVPFYRFVEGSVGGGGVSSAPLGNTWLGISSALSNELHKLIIYTT